MTEANLTFTDEGLLHIIRHYTHEAGVRSLEREISNICRKMARRVVKEGKELKVGDRRRKTSANFWAVIKYREIWAEKKNEIGLATGLAWTEVGGSVLSTEATIMQGKGRLTLTGKLGDVMQESAQAAMSYVRSRTAAIRPAAGFLPAHRYSRARSRRRDPEGRPVGRNHDCHLDRQRADAHSGALRRGHDRRNHAARQGAAHRRHEGKIAGGAPHGHAHRILPKDNEKDLAEIPPEIQAGLTLRFVENMDEVLQIALERPLVPAEHAAVAPEVAAKFETEAESDQELTN